MWREIAWSAGDLPSHQAEPVQKSLAIYASSLSSQHGETLEMRAGVGEAYPGRSRSLSKRWDQVGDNRRHCRAIVLSETVNLDTDISECHCQTMLLRLQIMVIVLCAGPAGRFAGVPRVFSDPGCLAACGGGKKTHNERTEGLSEEGMIIRGPSPDLNWGL